MRHSAGSSQPHQNIADVDEIRRRGCDDANARLAQDEDAILGMVAVVGPGVIVKGVDRAEALRIDSADRTPQQIAKVDEKIRRDAVDFAIQTLRGEAAGRQGPAQMVGDGGDLRGEISASGFKRLGRDDALRLPPGDVEEDTSIVAAIAPCSGTRPVDIEATQRHAPRRRRMSTLFQG